MSRDNFFTIKVKSINRKTSMLVTTFENRDGTFVPVETIETSFDLPFLEAWPKISSLLNDYAREDIFIPANNEVH